MKFSLYSQGVIEPPVIEYISINPASGNVFIQWTKSPTIKVNGYLIRDYKGFGGFTVAQVTDSMQTSLAFSYPKVLVQPVTFAMNAYRGDTTQLSGFSSPKHRPVFLSYDTSSCEHTITLKWTKYIGWGSQIKQYIIYSLDFQPDSIGAKSVNDTTFVIRNFDENKTYNYYISAVRNDGIIANSNKVTVMIPGVQAAAFIVADQASFTSDNAVEINFTLDPSSQIKNYQLTKSNNPDSSFKAIQTFSNYSSGILAANDTANGVAYYRLELLNHCNRPMKFSNLATAIFPKTTIQSGDVKISWNGYKDWPSGQSYNVYRLNNDTPELIGSSSQPTFTDVIKDLAGKNLSGNICYYVEAIANGGSAKSRSAKVCIDLDLTIFIPQAFTPNGDGKNDEFKPYFAFLPSDYSMVIFNRYGFKVFESKNTEKGWDGRLLNGTPAPDGVYAYFVTYKSSSGKTIERNGNFSLIYP